MPGSNEYSQYQEKEQLVGNESVKPPLPNGTNVQDGKPVENQDGQFKGNGDVIKYLENELKAHPLETPEQRKKRERREKWEGIISGISDAVSAVSNLYFTSQYAPNMYNNSQSMSEKAKARRERAKAERDALRDKHLHYALKIGQLKQADWEWRRQLAKDRMAAAKEERDAAMDDLNRDLMLKKISVADYDAKAGKVKAQYADAYEQARVEREKATAAANKARSVYYNSGGGGGKKISLTIDGRKLYFDSKDDYERAVKNYAKEYGIDTKEDAEELTEEETNGRFSGSKKSKKRSYREERDISSVAADVERASSASHRGKKTGLGLGNSKGKQTGLGL